MHEKDAELRVRRREHRAHAALAEALGEQVFPRDEIARPRARGGRGIAHVR